MAPAAMPIAAISTPSESTLVNRCRGVDPMASRTPNSRVRALTENASTPATPTTAISSAMPANPENTKAFSRAGDSTSVAHVLERRGALHRLQVRVKINSEGWMPELELPLQPEPDLATTKASLLVVVEVRIEHVQDLDSH